MKNSEDFVKYLFKRLPKNKLLAGTYYCGVTDSEIGTVPAHYLMGTTGQKATQWRLDYAYTKYYQSTYSKSEFDSKTQKWITENAYLYDCNGLIDAFVGQDNNAAGNYTNWCGIKDDEALEYITEKGELAAGACVFKRNSSGRIHHVGYVVGQNANGVPLIIEAKSFVDGIIMSTLNDGWNEYGIPNKILVFPEIERTRFRVTSPMQRGEKFELMQRALSANGYDVGKIDGKWGSKSQAGFDEMLSVNGKMAKVKVQINGVTVLNGEY